VKIIIENLGDGSVRATAEAEDGGTLSFTLDTAGLHAIVGEMALLNTHASTETDPAYIDVVVPFTAPEG